jgi:pSer/pThr/pTyr-binding forkhead associated (FHA) protein
MLTFEEKLLKVIDLCSTNGTYLNGQRLLPQQSRILRDGDELRLGNLAMQVQYLQADAPKP